MEEGRDSGMKRVSDALQLVFWAVAIVGFFIAIAKMGGVIGSAPPPQPTFSSAETISIVLTAVTVILAALAIVLAIAAVWGYTQILDAARTAAEKKAEAVAAEKAEAITARVIEILDARGERAGAGDEFAQAEAREGDDHAG
jgi:preprotein translocase subunit SecG